MTYAYVKAQVMSPGYLSTIGWPGRLESRLICLLLHLLCRLYQYYVCYASCQLSIGIPDSSISTEEVHQFYQQVTKCALVSSAKVSNHCHFIYRCLRD